MRELVMVLVAMVGRVLAATCVTFADPALLRAVVQVGMEMAALLDVECHQRSDSN